MNKLYLVYFGLWLTMLVSFFAVVITDNHRLRKRTNKLKGRKI